MKTNKSLELLKKTKKEDLDQSLLVDVWLEEFFGITLQSLVGDPRFYHKNTDFKKNSSALFYKTYSVTEEQYNWWNDLMMEILPKKHKVSKEVFKKTWGFLHINCAPQINYKSKTK